MARYWYYYTGVPGGQNIVGNYVISPANPDFICPGGTNLCAIYARGGTTPSSITQKIKDYFVLASNRQHPYPDLGQKPYVYVRP